jgi:hypothetical protein
MNDTFMEINNFKLQHLQIAVFFDDDNDVVSKSKGEFYKLSADLGFEEGKETILPTNVPTSVPYIIWNEKNINFQISKERADIIYSNLYEKSFNTIVDFNNNLKDYINTFLELLEKQGLKIYRVGLVVDYAWFDKEDNKIYPKQLEILRKLYYSNTNFENIAGFTSQIQRF